VDVFFFPKGTVSLTFAKDGQHVLRMRSISHQIDAVFHVERISANEVWVYEEGDAHGPFNGTFASMHIKYFALAPALSRHLLP
jgi:hypothetical protein